MNPPTFPPNDSVINKLKTTDIADQIGIMRMQEETTYKCTDYFSQYQNNPQGVDEACRLKMCEWCHQIASFCGYRRETVAIGMSLLDRYLSNYEEKNVRNALSDPKCFQLVAMTTLYISIKLHEPVVMDVETLSELSRGCYSMEDIEQMERQIFKTLKWRVNGPSKLDFIHHFISLLPASVSPAVTSMLLDLSQHQVELAVTDYAFVTVNHSVIALSAILNSLERIETDVFGIEDRIIFLQSVSDAYGDIDPLCLREIGMDLSELFDAKNARRHEMKAFATFQLISSHQPSVKPTKNMINIESRCFHQQKKPLFSLFRTR